MGKIGNKRKLPVTDDEVIKRYAEIKSAYKLEKEIGIGATTIYRILERNNINRDGLDLLRLRNRKFDQLQDNKIRAQYEGGMSLSDIVNAYKVSYDAAKSAIVRAGGVLTPICPRATPEETAEIINLYKAGFSHRTISLKIDRSQSFVSRVLRSEGFLHKKKVGADHPHWKGGKHTSPNGYVYVLLNRSDPNFVMANQSGYALEHRLEMARSLGRPIRNSETVHHINGIKNDNRIENLQLRQGRHGKHVAMCCHDCGSCNVGPVPLEE